jgi:hypothetical protein
MKRRPGRQQNGHTILDLLSGPAVPPPNQRTTASDQLAAAFSARVDVWHRWQENGFDGRIHERRGWRAQLLDQSLKANLISSRQLTPAAFLVTDPSLKPSIRRSV